MNDIHVRIADWNYDNADLRRIRESVFQQEQGVPAELEWDSEDDTATHFLAFEGQFAVGTARLLPDASIGRVAVLKNWRGMQIGEQIMQLVIAEAERQGMLQQELTAQIHATSFYQRLGFEVTSEEFIEAGIPHVEMVRHSQPNS